MAYSSEECVYNNQDGRPGCQTKLELEQIYWRNNNDPHAFWLCDQIGEPAKHVRCSDGHSFNQYDRICIPSETWKWTQPCDPPSLA